MPSYVGIGTSITHNVEVDGNLFLQDIEGGPDSTRVPLEIFSNLVSSSVESANSRMLRLRVQNYGETDTSNSYVTDMGIRGDPGKDYFFITAPQNTSNVGDQNTFVISTTSNVGIGTTDPTSTLHVVGNELITGTLTASNIVGGSPLTITSDQNLQVNSNLTVGNSNLFVDNVNGRVGVGTDSPSYKLHLREDVDGTSQIRIENQDSGNSGRARFAMQHLSNVAYVDLTKNNIMNIVNNAETESTAKLRLIQNGVRPIEFCTDGASNVRMIIDGTGNVGIGITTPGYKLHVVGDIYASGDITAFSDKRHKEDLLMIESALDKVKRLTGYTYTLHGNRSAGLLAQDVMEVLPEVVKGSEETNYSLAYGNLMGLIVEAIKELDKKIDRILEKQ